jgi:hypothetical protein
MHYFITGIPLYMQRADMRRIFWHVFTPCIIATVFFAMAFTPVEVSGCRTPGLLALGVSISSGLSGLGTWVIGLKKRGGSKADAICWIISTAILTIPVIGMIILA